MNITVAMPMPFQISTSATEYSARSGLPSQSGWGSPRAPRAVLIRPVDGCMRVAKVIPTATVLTSTGKKMMPRISVLSRILEVSSTASGREMITLRPLVSHGIDDRVAQPGGELGIAQERGVSCRGR